MSETDPNAQNRECGADVAAYSLGALEPAEAEAFRRHLETCAVCRDELAAFAEVVNALPMSAPAYPAPAGLRRRVLRSINDEPRLASDARDRSRSRRRRVGPTRFTMPRPALTLGTALAVAVVAVVAVIGLRSGSSSNGAARVVAAQVTGQGTAQLRIAGGHGELVVHHFASPPAGHIYEVWLKRGTGAPSPTKSLFSPNAAGEADVDVPGSLRGVSLVMVTPEPNGGSRVPTHPAVIRAVLS